MAEQSLPIDAGAGAQDVPQWLRLIDSAVIVLLNVTLVAEVRAGVRQHDGAHPLQLVGADGRRRDVAAVPDHLAFLGGAVSYSRGQFIAITMLVERAPRAWREFSQALRRVAA